MPVLNVDRTDFLREEDIVIFEDSVAVSRRARAPRPGRAAVPIAAGNGRRPLPAPSPRVEDGSKADALRRCPSIFDAEKHGGGEHERVLAERDRLAEDGLPLIAVKGIFYRDKRNRVLLRRAPGDLLNPRWLTAEAVEQLRASLPPHIFEAQYQQKPQWGGSGICTIDRVARYAEAPPFEVIIHSWDLAATKGGGDFTVCAKFGLAKDPSGRDIFYLTGVVRMRVELPDVRAHIAALDEAEKPALIIMDGVGIGMCVYQDLIRQGLKHIMPSGSMQKENVGSLKTRRFHATVPALYDGLVRIPDAMPGLEILLNEFAAFPDGKNDDQVDAIGNVAANREYVTRVARQYAERLGRFWPSRPAVPRQSAPPKSRDQELYDRRRRVDD